jgi:hypothetical protein
MAYVYERFGTYNIPRLGQKLDAGASEAVTVPLALPQGGSGDGLGSRRARPGARTLPLGFVLSAGDGSLETQLNTFMAWQGVRDKLWRRGDDGDVQWVYARLRKVSAPRDRAHTFWLEVSCEFEVYDPAWRGRSHSGAWTWDSGSVFDTGLYFDDNSGSFALTGTATTVCAVPGGGNDTAAPPKVAIKAGNANITSVIITATVDTGAIYLTWTGTLLATKTLVIDAARLLVTNDGADARASLVRHASNHTIAEWLRLTPGATTSVSIALVGGGTGSTATWTYTEGWS